MRCCLFDIVRQRGKHFFAGGCKAFVVGTEPFLFPAIWISTVTTATHVGLEPNPVAFVVAFLEALLANDAGRVLLAVFAFPRHVPRL